MMTVETWPLSFLSLLTEHGPKWLVWENVPGVLSSNGGRDFGAILGGMVELGYGFSYRVLDAQFIRVDGHPRAVPQRRRRVFVVGHLGGWQRAAAVLFERESLSGHSAPRRSQKKDVAPTISARTKGGGGLGTDFDLDGGLVSKTLLGKPNDSRAGDLDTYVAVSPALDASYGRLQGASLQDANHGHSQLVVFGGNNTSGPIDRATALNAKGGTGRSDFESETLVAHTLRGDGFDASEDGSGRGTPLIPVAFNAREDCVSGDVPGALGTSSPQAQAVAFAENSRAELSLCNGDGAIANLLKTGGGKPGQSYPAIATPLVSAMGKSGSRMPHEQGALIPEQWSVRRLTVTECERLMGFPDNYTAIPYPGGVSAAKLDEDFVKYVMRGNEKCLSREDVAALASDGPRYKALGNSMAVNCMRWIGMRIQMVDQRGDKLDH